jgi:chromosome segregation ATPase
MISVKKTILSMNKKYLIFVVSFVVIGFSSCVSKKKYLEMEAGRLKAEELSRKLDGENRDKAARIEALIADFEAMKNELMESNAMKEQHIDSLKTELGNLVSDLNKKERSLEETSFTLDFEKQRLTNALEAKEQSILGLQSENESLEARLSEKDSEIDERNFQLSKLNDQVKILEGKISEEQNSVAEKQAELEKVKLETSELLEEMKEKDTQITKLQNQVNLLKKEIGG